VAIARRFAIDWWRIQTGRIQPESVGLKMGFPAAYSVKALRQGRIAKTHS